MNIDLLVSVLKRCPAAPPPPTVSSSTRSASVRMREIENITTSRAAPSCVLPAALGRRVDVGPVAESLERVVDEATALAKITEDLVAGCRIRLP
jgi:hypothetical protein